MRAGVVSGLFRHFPLLLVLQIFVSPLVLAEQLLPQQVIHHVSEQLQSILANNRGRMKSDPAYVYQLVDDVLVPHMDFSRISSLVLGRYWRKATAAQRDQFSYQFQRLLVRTYATAFREFRDWQVTYLPLRMQAGDRDVTVRTQVSRAGAPPVAVVYRMHLIGGAWKAYDVKIEGISLVTNYRSSFTKLVRRGGMDGLIKRITRLNDKRSKPAKANG